MLKFCEVFFEAVNKKVFDVLLNDVHSVITDLDIYREVGHATAHDEYIPFTVSRGKLFIKDGVSEVRSGRLKVSFIKGQLDNPKINAIVLVKGADANEFPRLPPLAPQKKQLPKNGNDKPLHVSQLLDDEEPNPKDTEDDSVNYDQFEPLDGQTANEPSEASDRQRRTSGPKQPDPYASDNSFIITILLIVVATLIPIFILKCRL